MTRVCIAICINTNACTYVSINNDTLKHAIVSASPEQLLDSMGSPWLVVLCGLVPHAFKRGALLHGLPSMVGCACFLQHVPD